MRLITKLVPLVLLAVLTSGVSLSAANGTLKVTSFPSGAEVWVDGANSGKVTPMSISLAEGDHTVKVLIPNSGWNPDTRVVTIVVGNNDLSVTLLPALTTGPQGAKGDKGDPGAPGAPATVRSAAPTECSTGGIVVTSGDGLVSLPVCNGAQGLQGVQGIKGDPGPQGPQGTPGGVPAVDPITLVDTFGNVRVSGSRLDSRRGFGISPIYMQVETVQQTLQDGRTILVPGALHLGPFALAALDDEGSRDIEQWFELMRQGEFDNAKRDLLVELQDRSGQSIFSMELRECLPGALTLGLKGLFTTVVGCADDVQIQISQSLQFAVKAALPPGSGASTPVLGLDSDIQNVSELTGGSERIVGSGVQVDPIHVRVSEGNFNSQIEKATRDWVINTLRQDPGNVRNVELLERATDGSLTSIAVFEDVFLTYIGLLNTAWATGTSNDIPFGFDLVMQPNSRR